MPTISPFSSSSVSSWLSEFLSARQLAKPDGKPLYRYQVSADEYLQLRYLLGQHQRFGTVTQVSKEWSAAFVLYGAEWFRREYSLDWSWQPILKSLELELTQGEITDAVTAGLTQYWHRPLAKYHADRHDYVGSVFKEGGLPSNLLASEDNSYRSAFSAIFTRYHALKGLADNSVEQFIREKISRLPEALQKDESVELIAQMAEKLDSLVFRFNLDKQSQPAQYLDEQFPQWRSRFPLPLENEVAAGFLTHLLSKATESVRRGSRNRTSLNCTHSVCFANQKVTTEVSFPEHCVFDLQKHQLISSRIELALLEGDVPIASLGAAYVQFENDKASIRIRNAKISVRRTNHDSELYLAVMQAGSVITDVRLEDSAVDIGEVPLTLIAGDTGWKVIGQASTRTRHNEVLLLPPANAELTLVHGEFTQVDDSLSFQGLAATSLHGQCEVSTPEGDRYLITTGAEDFSSGQLVLRGEQLQWKSTPTLVFRGLPKAGLAFDTDDDGFLSTTTYLDGESLTGLSNAEITGRRLLVVKNKREMVLLRKRVGILPKDFEIELVSTGTPDVGIIKVLTASPCFVKVESPDVCVDALKKFTGGTELVLSAIDLPPASVKLAITTSLTSLPIVIEVPFPSCGVLAFDAHGKTLPPRVSVEDLLGCRLNLFSPSGYPAQFQIEAVSSAASSVHNPPHFKWHHKVTGKPIQVDLYGLKGALLELLSISDSLDAKVELSVVGPGSRFRLDVYRYATMLDHDQARYLVTGKSIAGSLSQPIRPLLIDLASPEQRPIPLVSRKSEGVPTGEFELPGFVSDGGPWLVIPERGAGVSFRAKFIAGSTDNINLNEVHSLQKAAKTFHPKFNPDVIANVLRMMSENWGHSGWKYLQDTFNNFSYLPLSTFEVWRHLVRDTQALALAVLRFECNGDFISQLERELPVFWQFVPLRHWHNAFVQMKTAMVGAGLPESLIEAATDNILSKLVVLIPCLEGEIAEYIKCGVVPKSEPIPMMSMAVQHLWYQELHRQHCDNNQWPSEQVHYLRQQCSANGLLPFELNTLHKFHDAVVLLPVFAAGVACGSIDANELKRLPVEAIFHFRQARDFDREWFESVYRCFVSYFANQNFSKD